MHVAYFAFVVLVGALACESKLPPPFPFGDPSVPNLVPSATVLPDVAKAPALGSSNPGTSAETLPLVREWFALGSGRRAKSDMPGDVTMDVVAGNSTQSNRHQYTFHLDQFRLTSARRLSDAPVRFAKECAIRLAVQPPKGKRIGRKLIAPATPSANDISAAATESIRCHSRLGGLLNYYHREAA
jgi:hypothetical protein